MENKLARVDLNLLVALQVLINERNVTRAAGRLHITQPAMSKTLQRLRELFQDPLFTRTSHGLVATPKTEQLMAPLAHVLEHIESNLLSGDFDPATVAGEICITAPEFIAIGVVPALLKRLQREAPHLRLQSRNILDDQNEQLADGRLDFAIHIEQEYGPDFEVTPLLTTLAVLWMRSGHPLARKRKLSSRDVGQYPVLALHIPNIHDRELITIRESLIRSGIERHPVLQTSQLLTALEVLMSTDAILMSPDYLGHFKLTKGHIISKPLPRGLGGVPAATEFVVPLCLIQHQRTTKSLLHRWLRQLIVDVCQP